MRDTLISGSYLLASVLFILGLRSLTRPDKARRGMQQAAVGMLFAVVGTLLNHTIVDYRWIAAGLVCVLAALAGVVGYAMTNPPREPGPTSATPPQPGLPDVRPSEKITTTRERELLAQVQLRECPAPIARTARGGRTCRRSGRGRRAPSRSHVRNACSVVAGHEPP